MSEQERKELQIEGELGLRALRRAVRLAHLNGTAYDPDGKGKAYWETHDEMGNPIEARKSA